MVGRTAVFIVVVLAGAVTRADEAQNTEAHRTVGKVLHALGGKEKLAEVKASTFKTKGKMHGFGAAVDFTGEMAVQGLAKGRTVMTFDLLGKTQTVIMVVNRDKGWVKAGDTVTEIDPKTLAVQVGDHGYIAEMAMLLPLARGDKGITLSPAGEAKVGDRPVTVVEVTRKGYSTVRLFLDKETALPLKLEWKATVADKAETHDVLLDSYQEVGGLKVAMKLTARRNGKVFYEYEMSDFRMVDQLDSKLLEKPQ